MLATLLRLLATLLVLTAFGIGIAAAAPLQYSGEVTYRERIALPPGASLRIALVDTDSGVAIVGANAAFSSAGRVPLQFELNVRTDLGKAGRYGLIAEIYSGGRVWFRGAAPVPVILENTDGLVLVVRAAPPEAIAAVITPPAAPAQLLVNTGLFDTIWQVRSIGGNPVHDGTAVSFSMAADRRAGGNGGCNNYFTEASVDAPGLRFGALAATRMACAPQVMVQEAALFAALANVTSFAVQPGVLALLGADHKPLVQLQSGQ